MDGFSASLCSQVPPSIREDGHRTNVSGMAGQSLTLECDANGFPAPEIVWLKDGQPVGVLWGGWAVGGIWIGTWMGSRTGRVWRGDVTGVLGDCSGQWRKPRGLHGGEGMALFWE